MSLNVYLDKPDSEILTSIAVGGRNLSLAEVRERLGEPGACINTPFNDNSEEYYSRNITHNLGMMAGEAGIYKALWRPEEIGVTTAAQLIPLLTEGLDLLESDPDRFRAFNPMNGWGDYEGLVEFVRGYLAACRDYPNARVSVSR